MKARAASWRCCLWSGPSRVADGAKLPILVLLGVVGAALLYGDGVITPAISVLSAMEGLKLVAPAFQEFIVPVTMAILIGLFMIQRKGTESIGRLFGPVMVVWFVVIGVLGATNIWVAPAIIKAINPTEAVGFLVANPVISFAVIGAVFLALTGGEALYADMGHVGPAAIRRAWFGLVLPALIFNYFGQGALILADPAAADNPFYRLAPNWALIPMVVLAALATIIASQSLISGVFSLTRQAMLMGLCPRARIVSTSSDEEGQIYVPAANWLLMTGTLLTVAAVQDFRQSGGRLRHRRVRNHAGHHASCSIASRLRVGAGRPPSRFRSSRPSARSTRHSWPLTR